MRCDEYKSCLAKESGEYVPYDVNGQYGQLFNIIEERQAALFYVHCKFFNMWAFIFEESRS